MAPPPPLDRHGPRPLWAQLQADVTARIRRGEFDAAFPGEHDLVKQYDVSRHTVREALRALRGSGLLEGGRGVPTRVVGRQVRPDVGTLYSIFAEVRATGARQRSIVRALEARADGVVASRLGLEESTPLVYLERLRLLDDEPLAHDRVWLPAQVAAPLLGTDFSETSLYAELERRCDVRLTGGREQVRAVVPTATQRRLLQLPDGQAAMHLTRTGEARGRPVEWRSTLVRGDRFVLDTDLARPDRVTASTARD